MQVSSSVEINDLFRCYSLVIKSWNALQNLRYVQIHTNCRKTKSCLYNIKWFNLIIYVHWAEIFGDYMIEHMCTCMYVYVYMIQVLLEAYKNYTEISWHGIFWYIQCARDLLVYIYVPLSLPYNVRMMIHLLGLAFFGIITLWMHGIIQQRCLWIYALLVAVLGKPSFFGRAGLNGLLIRSRCVVLSFFSCCNIHVLPLTVMM